MFNRRPIAHIKLAPSAADGSEARFKRFLRDLETYEHRLEYERTLDSFLDLYSAWKHTHQEDLKLRLVMLAFELHRIDPHFVCDLAFADQAPAHA